MTERINTLAIVGVGLIGGSLSLALKKHHAVGLVIGVGRSQANLDEALQLGVIDAVATMEQAAKADVIFVATPVAQMPRVFADLAPHLNAKSPHIPSQAPKKPAQPPPSPRCSKNVKPLSVPMQKRHPKLRITSEKCGKRPVLISTL